MCLIGGQLNSCILLEGFSNCQRGKTDLACYSSFLRSVILHYCIAILKAKNEKSEEWIPLTLLKKCYGCE